MDNIIMQNTLFEIEDSNESTPLLETDKINVYDILRERCCIVGRCCLGIFIAIILLILGVFVIMGILYGLDKIELFWSTRSERTHTIVAVIAAVILIPILFILAMIPFIACVYCIGFFIIGGLCLVLRKFNNEFFDALFQRYISFGKYFGICPF